jgi:GNAT superfamily N-acetyltransferase
MFQDMGTLPDERVQPLRETSQRVFAQWIPSGEYAGWLATPAGRPAEVIAGAGVHVRSRLPRADRARKRLDPGPQALIVNVYTERPWRRRGVAERLMRTVLDWTRAEGFDDVVLHASADGRHLYEKLGFTATNEMRYTRSGA